MLFAAFPFLPLMYFSLYLISVSLINMCLDVFLLGASTPESQIQSSNPLKVKQHPASCVAQQKNKIKKKKQKERRGIKQKNQTQDK